MNRSPSDGASTRLSIEAAVVNDFTVWPKWASEAIEQLFGSTMYRCDWPGSQYILQALADAYANQVELAAVA